MEVCQQQSENDLFEDHGASVDVNVTLFNKRRTSSNKSHWRNKTCGASVTPLFDAKNAGFKEFQVLTRETVALDLESTSGAYVVTSPNS